MASRKAFLTAVREALAAGGQQEKPGGQTFAVRPPSDTLRRAQEVRERTALQRERVLGRLEQMAGRMGWKVVKVATPEAAAQAVVDLAQGLGAKRVVRSAHSIFKVVDVDTALRAQGAEVAVVAFNQRDPGATRAGLREASIEADLGITGVDYMVAETSTAVILPRRGVSRLVSLLPPVHVALVRPQEVVETLADFLVLWQEALLTKGDLGSYASFISGPSRTGDIEQTIVIGAHGPKEVCLVLLGL